MSLRSLQKSWNQLGATDPFWAILTDPNKKNNGWDRAEFFSTGGPEVQYVLAWVERVHPLERKRRALDFGCGVGRLSQPLAECFEEVCGIDISPSMIELARQFNRYGERCRYVLNSSSDLSVFPDAHFDFIYSSITLQHIAPRFTKQYLTEFVRVLAPGGVLVFQLPAELVPGASSLMGRIIHRTYHDVYRRIFLADRPVIEMHGIERGEVLRILEARGARVLEMAPDQSAGPLWESYRYMVTRGVSEGVP